MKPYKHQIEAIAEVKEKLQLYGCCYLSAQMRVGKSLISLLSLDCDNVLILTKKNAISGWKDTIEAIGSNAEVMNYEQAHKIDSSKYTAIVLDESHSKISAFPKLSTTAEKVKSVSKGKKIVWLSGTPSPESFAQLFHQFYMSDYNPFRKYNNFYEWFDDYGIENSFVVNGKIIELYKETKSDKLLSAIQPYMVVITQQDAEFVSELDETIVSVYAEDSLYDMMEDLKTTGSISIGSLTIEVQNKLLLAQKLHQISGGTIKCDEVSISLSKHKVDWMLDNLKEYKKVLVLTNYIQEVKLLQEYLPNSTTSIDDFRFSNTKYFIGNMKAYCEGTDFSYCDAMVVYSQNFSSSTFQQARERLSKKDRITKPKIFYLHTKNSIDTDVYNAVSNKRDFTTRHFI